jgi:hypothetical protein
VPYGVGPVAVCRQTVEQDPETDVGIGIDAKQEKPSETVLFGTRMIAKAAGLSKEERAPNPDGFLPAICHVSDRTICGVKPPGEEHRPITDIYVTRKHTKLK